MELAELLPYILGAGGITFMVTVFNAVQAYRASAETREAKAVENLERWRNEADDRALRCLDDLAFERSLVAYWQRRSATLEHLLLRSGVETPVLPPPPERPISGTPPPFPPR